MLITINSEDYENAKKHSFKAKSIELVNGVGVDINSFHSVTQSEKAKLRKEYGYSDDDFLMIYPANLTAGKNHIMLFKALKKIAQNYNNVRLLCPGQQELIDEYKAIVQQMGIDDKVDFLGYRRDIANLVGLSDVSVSSSVREGLPVNLIEAMAIGNAIVATDVRGNRDVVKDGFNGYIVALNDDDKMAQKIIELINNPDIVEVFKNNNLKIVQNFSTESINNEMLKLYSKLGVL